MISAPLVHDIVNRFRTHDQEVCGRFSLSIRRWRGCQSAANSRSSAATRELARCRMETTSYIRAAPMNLSRAHEDHAATLSATRRRILVLMP